MNDRSNPIQARIPSATYRLQFNNQFTFNQATAIVDYLHDLGITDCYASPLLLARHGSLHCYDVIDHSKLNPEIGTEEEFITFARQLRQRDMGLMMDIVPNHMCISGGGNRWWNDVLENGPGSPFAEFFDIDWNPPKPDLINKVLLPVLGEQYGRVLENQEIKLSYHRGAFFVHYYQMRLPIAPRTYARILELLLPSVKPQLGEFQADVLELESIITALSHLPARTVLQPDKIKERRREKEIIKRRLSLLISANATMRAALKTALNEFNGVKGDSGSFDRLEALLAEQAYRLCYWRVASEEINYRRFFDINELAAIRVEEPIVFAAVHDLTLRLMKQGWVTGLRIDHVDGLFDPAQYLFNLQQASLIPLAQARESTTGKALSRTHPRILPTDGTNKPCYVLVEKILGHHESLNTNWPVHGTTGHDFLNLLNGVFVDTSKALAFKRLYERFTNNTTSFDDLTYECKKLILRVAMSSELHVLARRLDRISEQHRYSRDFTLNSLQYALAELVACFPVYRSYLTAHQDSVSPEDRVYILTAIRKAKRRNPATSPSLFDFIGSILLLNDPDGLTDAERQMRRDFVSRFQQLTGPVMAKGLEDTAFYRRYPLSSLNEVGGEPESFGVTRENFHLQNQRRALLWPNSLSATSTHDTKRSEDLRARINALSEIPTRWYHAILRWQNLNLEKKTQLEESVAPDSNEEYLFYQTLIGICPFTPIGQMNAEAHATFLQRIEEYLIKALREAKLHSSWISPDESYELALRKFVRAALNPGDDNDFLKSFSEFQATISRAGIFNSLSQTLLKIASPGVPDFYQGTELWNFNLVDPDNRRTVDYAQRRKILASMVGKTTGNPTSTVAEMLRNPEDGRIKFYLTRQALRFRRDHHNLFLNGRYLPLRATGKKERHIVAFARVTEEQTAVAIAGRFFTQLGDAAQLPLGNQVWGETAVLLLDELRAARYRDVLTGQEVKVIEKHGRRMLPLADVFTHLPAALLEQVA